MAGSDSSMHLAAARGGATGFSGFSRQGVAREPSASKASFGLAGRAALAASLIALAAFAAGSDVALAQQGVAPPPASPSPAKPAKAAQPKAPAEQATPQAQGGDGALRARVEQLEAQLVDLQVVIGTLESLAKSGGPRPVMPTQSGPMSGSDQSRLDGLETQVRALTSQVEQLAQEVRGQGMGLGGRRSDVAPQGAASGAPEHAAGGAFGSSAPSVGSQQGPAVEPGQPGRFGSTTVSSDNLDPIGSLAQEDPSGARPDAKTQQWAATQPSPGGADAGANPKQLYETAYGYLLQQDYGAAQAGFGDFLKRFPKDALAPNALYWLGETHYVQKNYSDAAEAFDLVVTGYGSTSKAPDALLKRGMALAQLGKKSEACAALRDVGTKYPNVPQLTKSKAEGERQRVGCP